MNPGTLVRAAALAVAVAVSSLAPAAASPHGKQAASDAAAWREDLRVLAAELARRHRNLFHHTTRAEFDAAVRALDASIPTLSRHEIVVGFARIVAMASDGHTQLRGFPFHPAYGLRFFPVGLYHFKDGVHIYAADAKYRDAVGGRVISVGGRPAAEALAAVEGFISRDNAMGARLYGPYMLMVPEVLNAARIVDDMERVPLVVERDGNRTTVTLEPAPAPRLHGPPVGFFRAPDWVDARDLARPPLWLERAGEPFWFKHLEESRTLYVQYNAVANRQDETVEAFAKRLFAFAENHPVDRIVFDLRWNGGGNNSLNRPLLLGLVKSRFDAPGKVFVLTSRHTFSAAQNFVNVFDRFTNATFVGEPTGARPNHYGDARPFRLPHSGFEVYASTLWWQDMDPRDDRPWTPPDVAVELSFAEYRSGVDPVLAAAIAFVPQPPLAERMSDAYAAGDAWLAAKLFREFRADPAHAYASVERDLNRLGYTLLGGGRVDAAIGVFKPVVEADPVSWNAYDTPAEAYLKSGNRELARRNYERSLELNPDNAGAVQALEGLRTVPD